MSAGRTQGEPEDINGELLAALEDLFAMVQGEVPSLLEDHHSWVTITDVIAKARAAPAPATPAGPEKRQCSNLFHNKFGGPDEPWMCGSCGEGWKVRLPAPAGIINAISADPKIDSAPAGPEPLDLSLLEKLHAADVTTRHLTDYSKKKMDGRRAGEPPANMTMVEAIITWWEAGVRNEILGAGDTQPAVPRRKVQPPVKPPDHPGVAGAAARMKAAQPAVPLSVREAAEQIADELDHYGWTEQREARKAWLLTFEQILSRVAVPRDARNVNDEAEEARLRALDAQEQYASLTPQASQQPEGETDVADVEDTGWPFERKECASDHRGFACERETGHPGDHTHWVEGYGNMAWPPIQPSGATCAAGYEPFFQVDGSAVACQLLRGHDGSHLWDAPGHSIQWPQGVQPSGAVAAPEEEA